MDVSSVTSPQRLSLARLNLGALIALLSLQACAKAKFAPIDPAPAGDLAVAASVYLIGDAGYTGRYPILYQLKQDVLRSSERADVVVAFLGDNVYPRGLHPPSHPDHDREVAYLEAQIEVLRGTSAKGVFVPGNHDWGYKGRRGLEQLRRQAEYLTRAAASGVDVVMLPPPGCPGPHLLPIGTAALLVSIETDLWLREHDWSESQHCPQRSLDESLRSLSDALAANDGDVKRQVVVLAHHPLQTYGPHGGYFGLKDQFFPATNIWSPLYIPIPFLYAIVRNLGTSRQDLANPGNTRMREQLAEVFREFSDQPLVYASGHDHGLQVFHGGQYGVGYTLVSGAGSKLNDIGKDEALFAAGRQQGERGYMRLDFLEDGRVLLRVVTDGTRACADGASPSCQAQATLRYWRWLRG